MLRISGLLIVFVFVACSPERPAFEDTPLESEEIGGGIDVELSTEDDEKGRQVARPGAVLPGDFPADLPLPAQFSIVDLGTGTDDAYVVLQTPAQLGAVRESLSRRLRDLGWSVEPAGGGFSSARGERRVVWALADTRPGTQIRIDY